jgi:hypothetical protein
MDTHRTTTDQKYFPAMTVSGRRIVWLIVASCTTLFSLPVANSSAEPLLPDLIAWADDPLNYMYGGSFETSAVENTVRYRFTGALPNIGAGPLEVREVTHPNQIQDIYQRVHQSEGGVVETLLGSFQKLETPFGHLFLPGIAQYRLREVTEGNGVGEILSSQDKTSMALVDGNDYDTDLPNSPIFRVYDDVDAEYLGVSVGWADIYGRNLPGQWADATGLPDGEYWLEVMADPENLILESDETNNATRILVNLTIPVPGDYNGDETVNAADYTTWRNTLGRFVTPGTGADGDVDGRVDIDDFSAWKLRFGNTKSGAGAVFGEAPEPSSLLLVGMGMCLILSLRPIRIFG